jgi:hypothetical protein
MPSASELAYLVKHSEPDSTNLSTYLIENFDRLRSYVPSRTSKIDLVGMRDADLAPLVTRKLEHRRTIAAEQREDVSRQRAQRAAARLAQGPRRGGSVLVSPALLLRDLLADSSTPIIVFRMDDVDLPFRRSRLWQVARVVFDKDDVQCWLDPGGLHLRWNGSRGGLNLRSEPLPAKAVRTLTVDLRRPVDAAPLESATGAALVPDPAVELPEYQVNDDLPVFVVPPSTPTPRRRAIKPRPSWFDFSIFF